MPDRITKEARSRLMSRIHGKDTGPEIRLRMALWQAGLRYRKQYGKERIDIAFPHQKVAVFVDGCFWHRCPMHGNMPENNRAYWEPKLRANVERDRRKNERLRAAGWEVVRIWEHELTHLEAAKARVAGAVRRRRTGK